MGRKTTTMMSKTLTLTALVALSTMPVSAKFSAGSTSGWDAFGRNDDAWKYSGGINEGLRELYKGLQEGSTELYQGLQEGSTELYQGLRDGVNVDRNNRTVTVGGRDGIYMDGNTLEMGGRDGLRIRNNGEIRR